MSGSSQDQSRYVTTNAGLSEAESILTNPRALRNQIVTAWRERAVVLDKEERAELQGEIRQTCDFLSDLIQDD